MKLITDAVWGRWVSPDPAGLGAVDPSNPQSWNRYAYVANNPLANIDPLGLQQGQAAGIISNCTSVPSNPCGQFWGCNFSGAGNLWSAFDFLNNQTLPDTNSGWEPVGSGDQGECPGCFVNMVTDQIWDPDEEEGFYAVASSTNGNDSGSDTTGGANNGGTACPNGGTSVRMLVTGYDNSFQSTGKNPGDPGYGMTASGSVAANGTIAAPRSYPFGTKIDVPGYGLGTVLDRGGAIRNLHIDLWFPTTQRAINWGAPHLEVTVCK